MWTLLPKIVDLVGIEAAEVGPKLFLLLLPWYFLLLVLVLRAVLLFLRQQQMKA